MKYTLTLLLLFVTLTTFSQIPQPIKDTYVNDFAKVLSKSQIKNLNDSINLIEKSSGVQLAIVIVNKIPKEYDIEEYSLLIARRWKVGNKEDGLVYVAAVNQRKQRLEVARNIESIFTTENSQDVLTKTKAHFRLKHYGKGIAALVSTIAFKLDSAGYGKAQAVQPLAAVNEKNVKAPAQKTDDSSPSVKVILGVLVGVVLFSFFMAFRSGARRYNGYGGGYNNSGRSSLGSFASGAATGFIFNELLGRRRNNNQQQYHVNQDNHRWQDEDSQSTGSTSGFGNWGSSRGSSGGGSSSSSGGSSSSSGGSSSSSGGFSGGGASSDW
ncbi:TPM domain-containing protein [Pedobacter jeongneungensis]|uniref:TPM domain-containing protein n=1 Tax=Pedobacter jeongneungensis TaxID=947309 RepID=UPI0004684A3F|nr:TPM domain-containing protein [Pedobacter jeongneungensis]